MKIIDNNSTILGDELRSSLGRSSRLRIAASCFSIYAYEALKSELNKVESVQFVFTTPTFVPSEVTDKIRKEHREFFIPKGIRESSVYGTEFEIQLRNKLNQKAIARECARKFFAEISRADLPNNVRYDVVDSYAKLMDLVARQ